MLNDEKAAIKRQMENFFKKVDRRAAESAEDIMRKYTEKVHAPQAESEQINE